MSQSPQDFLERLQALREDYVTGLPDRIAEIEQDWKAVTERAAPGAKEGLHRKLHGMAGSAGTFGLADLSRQARSLELHIQKLAAGAAEASDPAEHAVISAGIAQLRRLATGGAKPRGPGLTSLPETEPRFTAGTDRLVYLMEEDPARSARLQSKLAHFGYRTELFHDRDALARALQERPPMALILDFHSREVLAPCIRWLTAYQREREVMLPVIFISGEAGFPARLEAVRAGGFAYLEQPADIATLVDRLDALRADRIPEPYRVVVVEDDAHLAQHYELVLRQAGIEVRLVSDPAGIPRLLAEFQPDVMMMDLYMPGCTGMELARLIRQDPSYVSMPIVFLSAETDPDIQYSALMTGGDDFIAKPILDRQLIAVVHSRALRARALESAMSRDSLTGLLKHTKIKELLQMELARLERSGGTLSFAMLDIDLFKRINDTYGHPAGDRVIKSLAHLLRQRLRSTDLVGRYGGEEFAAILPDTDLDGACALLEEVRRAFGELEFDADGKSFSVTLSAGVVSCRAGGDAAHVTEQADRALYEAKGSGRNRIVAVDLG
jgi:diguanylate cyclase (GGDEF)-like protein